MRMQLTDLASIPHLASENLGALDRRPFTGVSSDSRDVKAGNVFFALRGESFDGHAFVTKAFESGASCAVVDGRADRTAYRDRPHLVVSDTTRALGDLAALYRGKFSIPVIAIAGSNGKTTTKEMTTKVLAAKYSVHSTQGNLNNHIGVPRTIFGLSTLHEAATACAPLTAYH